MVPVLLSLLILLTSCATTDPRYRTISYKEEPHSYGYIQSISNKLLPVMDAPNASNYMIALVDTPELVASASCQDNYVLFFSKGTLNFFDQNEILYVMGHEIAHVKLGHCVKQTAVRHGTSTIFSIMDVFVPGTGLLNIAVNPIVTSAYSRSQEAEADIVAVEALQKINVPYTYAVNALERLRAYARQKDPDEDRIGILSTHPALSDRIERIQERWGKR